MKIRTVTQEEAYHHCNPDDFPFETTAEIKELISYIGQERALEAVEFAISMPSRGFNLFVVGPEGSGRHSVVQSFIHKQAKNKTTPSDWCYVYNFESAHQPLVLEFPPQQGPVFKKEMSELIEAVKTTLPTIFEGDDYRIRIKALGEQLQQKVDKLYEGLINKGKEQSIAVIRNDQGMMFSPMDEKGEPMDLESFKKLPESTKKEFEKRIENLHGTLHKTVHEVNKVNREAKEQQKKLKEETAGLSIGQLIHALLNKYADHEKVIAYLKSITAQLVEHVDDFLQDADGHQNPFLSLKPGPPTFNQYGVNVLVSQTEAGAPVIYEDMPTYQNVHGRIEHQAQMGMLTTNFSLIRPGALHRANGGYIIIDARRLLMQPFAYEGLKRTLRSRQIRIEPVERLFGLVSTVSLEPEPVPLEVKVVLIGEPMIYYLLQAHDPEFNTLFKVQADFEYDMERNAASQQQYAALIGTLAGEKNLLPLHKTAVARVTEEAARHAGDSSKLSLHIRKIADLIKEADYLARKTDKHHIDSQDIEMALKASERRGGRIGDRIFSSIEENIRHIDTSGKKIGQVNGLSVVGIGDNMFGFPTRITAVTRPGKGNIVDIEREVELAGPIHSKGVMILGGFLNSRYARNIPLGLQASLVFEQSYGGVEGDSASCGELCALLSSLAGVPIRQDIAITGSVSQLGEIQPVGGVNEKIEGFFDICKARGLTGSEGVIIPETNVRHLMLKKEVVEAVGKQQFSIYLVTKVDEAIALLTGLEAGEPSEDGYPKDSINSRVEATLLRFAQDLRAFNKGKSIQQDSES